MAARVDALLATLREAHAPVPAGALATRLGISQPTLSRAAADAGQRVVRIGRARATRYALSREVPRAGSRWPLYRIDPDGSPHRLGELRALHGGAFHLEVVRRTTSLRGAFALGLFPGLPWFLDDVRPQGFLGRAFARAYADEVDAPTDVQRWNDDHVLRAWLRHGENLAGDLVLGEASLERALRFIRNPSDAIEPAKRETRFIELADAAMRGELPGSSAAGERPKFLATLREPGGGRSVLVKLSERAGSPAAQRWADLLRCERLASDTLRAHGIAAAHEEIVEAGGRTFLQSTRFDRTPRLGRRGFVSLASLDVAHLARGHGEWWRFAEPLRRDGWITEEDARRLRRLSLFGRFIANTDMHLGNVAFEMADALPLALCPAYDMLPMRFAPAGTGEIVPRDHDVAPPLPEILDDWRFAALAAEDFWQRVCGSDAISADFRSVAERALQTVGDARSRYAG
ncbi:MAG: type II toxin-antitoxin system HipA family toxin YjjJ [Deltaproteobacteria bacterium]|nr:type II toxin-antitoxin system HipA family toxin YjjJ [Deltaproteobacteria bacterium]